METYFYYIQEKKWYWTLFVNNYENTLNAVYKISKLFNPAEDIELLEYRSAIAISYLGLSTPSR